MEQFIELSTGFAQLLLWNRQISCFAFKSTFSEQLPRLLNDKIVDAEQTGDGYEKLV